MSTNKSACRAVFPEIQLYELGLCTTIGYLVEIILGTRWLARLLGFHNAYANGLAPFLLGAVAKSLLAVATVLPVMKLVGSKSQGENG
jgi:biotin transporter BioY